MHVSAVRLRSRWRESLTFYLLISPWLIGLVCFILGPVVASFVLGFFKWDLISPPRFVGLQNYREMLFMDPLFKKSLAVTLIYVGVRVPLAMLTALWLALMMNQKVPGIGVFRTIYYLPSVVSGVAVSMLWIWVFNPNFGLMNGLLNLVGLPGPGWFSSPDWALPTLIATSLYTVGSAAVIFLAGLKNVPDHLYEAARLDGASAWRQFVSITLPQLSPTILFNLIMTIISSFQAFTEALIITNGGPVNSTLLYNLYLYQNAFTYSKLGYACALSWIMVAITLALALSTLKSSRKWVYYEGGE